MIPVGSIVNASDNSGAKKLRILGIPGSSKRRFAYIGDVITVTVKGASSTGYVKDHSIAKAVVVRTRKETRRKDGSYVRFDDNAVVVITKDNIPVGTRVFGPIAREIRDLGFLKIASLAKEVW